MQRLPHSHLQDGVLGQYVGPNPQGSFPKPLPHQYPTRPYTCQSSASNATASRLSIHAAFLATQRPFARQQVSGVRSYKSLFKHSMAAVGWLRQAYIVCYGSLAVRHHPPPYPLGEPKQLFACRSNPINDCLRPEPFSCQPTHVRVGNRGSRNKQAFIKLKLPTTAPSEAVTGQCSPADQVLRRSSMARAMVPASTYSSSPPTGTPRARRVTARPRAFNISLM